MRTQFFLFFIILFSAFTFSACLPQKQNTAQSQTASSSANSESTSSAEVTPFQVFTARFEIYTKGTKRIFTLPMYHNQSEEVYITSKDPSVIYITKTGITWSDFFATLPFSLTDDCLVTGTQQTFCTNEDYQLVFVLNGVETPNSLQRPIQENDFLIVKYIEK